MIRPRVAIAVALVQVVAFSACGGGDSDSDTDGLGTAAVTAESECADAPDPVDVDSKPAADPDLPEALMVLAFCEDRGQVRPVWPDGISKEEALSYASRVCSAGRNTPPTPQEWYELHDGPSTEVDDFALAIADEIESGRAKGFGLC